MAQLAARWPTIGFWLLALMFAAIILTNMTWLWEASDSSVTLKQTQQPIVIGLVVAGRSMPDDQIASLPLLSIFLPSFLRSITADPPGRFAYRLYFGFDRGDPLLDNNELLSEFCRRFRKLSGSAPLRLQTYAFTNTTVFDCIYTTVAETV